MVTFYLSYAFRGSFVGAQGMGLIPCGRIKILLIASLSITWEIYAEGNSGTTTAPTSSTIFITKNQIIEYIPVDKLRPTQTRYSAREVALKVKELKAEGKIGKNGKLPFHHHTSLFSKKKAIFVIQKGDLYYVVDGHHHTKISIELGAKAMPAKVLGVYKGKDEDFWTVLESQHKAYLVGIDGKRHIPENFNTLHDDPLRYFAAVTALKKEEKLNPCLKKPLWKKGKDAPDFIEFLIADKLRENGFVFNNGDDESCEVLQKKVEDAREILNTHTIPNFMPLK